MSSRAPNVIVVSAPSGAGKSTVLARVLRELEGIRFSVSHTTRPPRSGETDGVDYHFVDRAAFETLIRDGLLLERAEVHGHLYGTARSEYERAEREGTDLLLDLDVQGADSVRGLFAEAVTIFILPPSYQELETRLRGRGQDAEATIARRLQAAREESALYGHYDYVIVNEDLEACVSDLEAVIRAARRRTSRMEEEARRILRTFEERQRSR